MCTPVRNGAKIPKDEESRHPSSSVVTTLYDFIIQSVPFSRSLFTRGKKARNEIEEDGKTRKHAVLAFKHYRIVHESPSSSFASFPRSSI